jgi:2'-5' RNA ligase
MRLFLALYPPQSYLKYITEIMREFDKEKRNLRNVPLEQIHVTLKFIGSEVSLASYEEIHKMLKQFEGQYVKPEIKNHGVHLGFPGQIDPRHLIINIESTDTLLELSDTVHKLIKHLGLRDTIKWKDKQFNEFHVSIAKLKDSASSAKGKDIRRMAASLRTKIPEAFYPEEMVLVESILENNVPKYRKLASIKL